MNEKTTNQKFTDALKSLMVRLPEKRGLALKAANKLSHVDLYKYRKDCIIPLTRSLYSFGDAFQIATYWLVMMASYVAKGHMTEEQALKILGEWPRYKPQFEEVFEFAIHKAVEKCSL